MSRRGDAYRGRRQGPLSPEQVVKSREARAARRRPFIIPKTAASGLNLAEVRGWYRVWKAMLESGSEPGLIAVTGQARGWPRNEAGEGAARALKAYNKQKEKETKT